MYNFTESSLLEELNVSRIDHIDTRTIDDHSLVGMAKIAIDGTITAVNPLFSQIIGYQTSFLLQQKFVHLLTQSGQNQFTRLFDQLVAGERASFNVHLPVAQESSVTKWLFIAVTAEAGTTDTCENIIAVIHNIDELKQREAQENLSSLAFSHSGDGILITDADNTIIQSNPAFSKISGFSENEIIGRKPFLLRSGEHDESFYNRIWKTLELEGLWQGEICYRHKTGSLFYVWETISAVTDNDDNLLHYVSILADMTEIKERQQVLDDLANYDSLTDLPNRHYLDANLKQATEMSKRRGDKVAVLFIDLDKFKPVNDIYGHKAGDTLLIEIADRLSKSVRLEDTAARIGGDEFVVLMPKISNRDVIEGIAERVYAEIIKPVMIHDDIEVSVSASIGISIFPDDLDAVSQGELFPQFNQYTEIIELADHAMYVAKEKTLPLCFFDQIESPILVGKH